MKYFRSSSISDAGGDESSSQPLTQESAPIQESNDKPKVRDDLDDDLDALLGDDSEKSSAINVLVGNGSTHQEQDILQDSEVFEKGINEMSNEMKTLADEKIRLADKVAELNEQVANQQSRMLSLEEDFTFRQSEMTAHIAKQERQRDQLDEEVELLKHKIHLLASDIKQDQTSSLSSVFRRKTDEAEEPNPNEVEMETWRTETTTKPNAEAEEKMRELKEMLQSKGLECIELRQSVNQLTVKNRELQDENARLRAELTFEKENQLSRRKYSGDASIGSSTAGGTAGNDLFISNLNEMMKQGVCLYELSPLATNSKQIDFYLPKLRVFCPCGKHSVSDDTGTDDPTSLLSILRPWQIEFLKSVDVMDTMQLLQASRHSASDIAKQMRKWRRKKKMDSFRTASCSVALHIWSRTCIRVLKNVHQQKVQGRTKPVLPDFMEYKLDPDLVTVSSMGQVSHQHFEEESSKPASRVLFGVPETRPAIRDMSEEDKRVQK